MNVRRWKLCGKIFYISNKSAFEVLLLKLFGWKLQGFLMPDWYYYFWNLCVTDCWIMILVSMSQLVLPIQLNILSLHALLFECQKYSHESTVADCWPSLLYQDRIRLKSVSDEDTSVSVVCSLLLVNSLGCENAEKSFRIVYVCAIFSRSLHIKNTEWKQRTIFIM